MSTEIDDYKFSAWRKTIKLELNLEENSFAWLYEQINKLEDLDSNEENCRMEIIGQFDENLKKIEFECPSEWTNTLPIWY